MTKEEEKWAKRLRTRMEGYQKPPSDELWARIERDLPASPSAKIVPMWRNRKLMAAAAVAVVLVSSVTTWLLHSPEAEYVKTESIVARELSDEPASGNELPSLSQQPEPVSSALVQAEVKQKAASYKSEPILLEENETETVTENAQTLTEEIQDAKAAVLSANSEKDRANTGLSSGERAKADRRTMEENRQRLLASKSKRDSKEAWTVGVATGNTPYSSSSSAQSGLSSFRVMSANTVMSSPTVNNGLLASYVREESTTDVRHKMPVTVGASVTYGLSDHWALETGLYYSYLASDFRAGTRAENSVKQKLHYVGVPLKLRRSVWNNRRVAVYASAGAMVERCVKGTQDITYTEEPLGGMMVMSAADSYTFSEIPSAVKQEHVSVEEHPWQCSVQCTAGLQVNLSKRIGIYAEPGMAYYFDDKSGLQTIRKEHPFTFNLQVGLRYDLTK